MINDVYKTKGKIINDINVFIDKSKLEGDTLKFTKLYDAYSPFYHIISKLSCKIKFGGEKIFRSEFLKNINIENNNLILEISVGTADNFYYLSKNAKYYGVDISLGMLRQALKHIKKWKINAELVCYKAENLPFVDNIFDVVYSCGGMNFYDNKQKAIEEMIRVAKHGTKIFIIDGAKNKSCNESEANIIVNLLPKGMKNIKTEIICKRYMYIVSFEKP